MNCKNSNEFSVKLLGNSTIAGFPENKSRQDLSTGVIYSWKLLTPYLGQPSRAFRKQNSPKELSMNSL